jgi:antiviral defense system Shedu protein SduA
MICSMEQDEFNNPARDDGPPPMPEPEYFAAAMAKYHEVLDSAVDEKSMQTFFEEHPPLLPFGFPDYTGHGPYLQALVSQPELAGLGVRQPDFLWLSRNSGEICPVLIEIEKPTKRWATAGKNPQPTAELTQALNQLRQWREWMRNPQNVMIFLERYGVPLNWRRRQFSPLYVLIYGRKARTRRRSRSYEPSMGAPISALSPMTTSAPSLAKRTTSPSRTTVSALSARFTCQQPQS